MGQEYKNQGTKIDHHKTSNRLLRKLNKKNNLHIEEQIDNAELILKEPDINSFIPDMFYQIKRLINCYTKN